MKRTLTLRTYAILLAALFLEFGEMAEAAFMNFETASAGGLLTTPFEQNGVRLAVTAGHYDLWTCPFSGACVPGNGSIIAGLDGVQTGPATVRISLISGSLFNLDSIGILAADGFSSISAPNGTTFVFGNSPALFNVALQQFRSIPYFELSSNVDIAGGFLFDNITVSAIPEPSTLVCLGLALAALAFAPRHR